MEYKMKKYINKLILLTILAIGLNSCEDSLPDQYVNQTIVQGYLLVDKPISGILVTNSKPIFGKFDETSAQITNAIVQIYYLNSTTNKFDTLNLQYRGFGEIGYYYHDANLLVKPNTTYYLKIQLNNGKIITGQTSTPERFDWVNAPKEKVYYPTDTLKLPHMPEYDISWTKASKSNFYLIRTICHDTVEYGKYLSPADPGDKNRKCYNLISHMDENQKHTYYKNVTNWNLIGDSITPTVWMAFKWFGSHTVTVYSPDNNMFNWFKNTYFTNSTENDPLLSSVKGSNTYGVFGSAAIVEKDMFLYKNQK